MNLRRFLEKVGIGDPLAGPQGFLTDLQTEMISQEDKKEFTKRVVELVEQSIEEHEALVDGLPIEVVDWFYEYVNGNNEEKLRIAESYIYQPEDFEDYRRELKIKGLPDSEISD